MHDAQLADLFGAIEAALVDLDVMRTREGEHLRADLDRHRALVIDLVERALVARALAQCGQNQVHAARLLGISRNTLRHRIKKYNLEPPEQQGWATE